jgi:transporter family protein
MNWLSAAFLALFSFGIWGFFTKMAVLHIDSKSALIYQTAGVMVVGVITLGFMNFKPATDIRGISYATITGIAYGIGCLFYFIAASKGKIITVVTLTALYPLIAILLAYWLLNEMVSIKQCLGIARAFVAILLMST